MSGRCSGSIKACYGHTEGTAGIHGALLAVLALRRRGVPAIMHLRNLNPYVEASLEDWQTSCCVAASVPKVMLLDSAPSTNQANQVEMDAV